MRFYLSFLFCVCFLLIGDKLYAQVNEVQGEYTIEWITPTASSTATSQSKVRLSFKGAAYNENDLPVYSLYLYGESWSSASLITLETEDIKDASNVYLPSTIEAPTTQILMQKGVPVTLVQFVPLIATSTGFAKITRFRLNGNATVVEPVSRSLIQNSSFYGGRQAARTSATTGSALASGKWVKFPVTQDGLYKIDYNFLQTNGFNPSAIDPSQIQIFGNGGGMLPQANSATRYDDLIENAIQVVDGGDGSFDPGDYVLFYAKGPHTWTLNTTTNLYEHQYNVYSEQAYYFLTIGSGGLRVTSRSSLGSGAQSFNYFDDRQFIETDKYNVLKSGRQWFGDLYSTNTFLSNSYSFDWAGGIGGTTVNLSVSVLGRSNNTTSFSVKFNQTSLSPSMGLSALSTSGTYPPVGVPLSKTYPVIPSSDYNTANVTLTFNNFGNFTSQANLDYLRLQGPRVLQVYGGQTIFRCIASTAQPTTEYRIQNADSSLSVWDITDPLHPQAISYSVVGTEAVFSDQSDVLREYVCFKGTTFNTPGSAIAVKNQNLHANNAPSLPDMVIVSHPSLVSQANQLKTHREKEGLDVLVVTTEEVYNEFSSGAQDITAIRDFMKMLYDRNTATDSVRFLLLFGSCSYDYKDRVANNKNLVPCYESYNSLEPLKSYSSEDYFCFMDNSEGAWPESPSVNASMDISIGRIPAKNVEEASAMVNKIIHYQSSTSTENKWKNRITFVADDGDSNLHLDDAEYMSDLVASEDKRYNLNKIYLDAYPQESSAGGEKSPIVKQMITDDISKGVFIMNYSGHGGTSAWAQELILDVAQVGSWTNIDAMPLMITATCDFGLYDDPAIFSGSEAVLFNANGGGIAMVTSARVVYQYSNRKLNEEIYKAVFVPYGTEVLPRMGDVFKLAKNRSLIDVNNRNYAYMGDPSMRLAYPKEKIVITKINGTAVSSVADTLKALSKVTIEGEVRDFNNGPVSWNTNSTAYITCFDKQSSITTLGNQSDPTTFKLLNNVFFEGKASVDNNGKFSVNFVVPKDISYLYDQGKISIYAANANSLDDAGGYYDNVQIGGSNPSAPTDNTPPVVALYMNDNTFVSGGMTNNNPTFLAEVQDENGINVGTSGVGHEITITTSNNPNVVILNEYYSTALDDYTKGTVRYPLKNLPAGNYSLKFKVWDTYNNSTESYLEFVVANSDKMAIDHVLNYPNPFSTHTEFHFDHNRAGDDLEVLIQIYTVSGKMIKSLDHMALGSSTHISGMIWDGRDDFGDKIGKGVYVYKIKVRSLRDGSTTHQFQKLVLLN